MKSLSTLRSADSARLELTWPYHMHRERCNRHSDDKQRNWVFKRLYEILPNIVQQGVWKADSLTKIKIHGDDSATEIRKAKKMQSDHL